MTDNIQQVLSKLNLALNKQPFSFFFVFSEGTIPYLHYESNNYFVNID